MRFSFSVGETRSKGGAAATKKNNICKRFGPRKCPMLVSSTFILVHSYFDLVSLLLAQLVTRTVAQMATQLII